MFGKGRVGGWVGGGGKGACEKERNIQILKMGLFLFCFGFFVKTF